MKIYYVNHISDPLDPLLLPIMSILPGGMHYRRRLRVMQGKIQC